MSVSDKQKLNDRYLDEKYRTGPDHNRVKWIIDYQPDTDMGVKWNAHTDCTRIWSYGPCEVSGFAPTLKDAKARARLACDALSALVGPVNWEPPT